MAEHLSCLYICLTKNKPTLNLVSGIAVKLIPNEKPKSFSFDIWAQTIVSGRFEASPATKHMRLTMRACHLIYLVFFVVYAKNTLTGPYV